MLRIFNKQKGYEITIDDTHHSVTITPKDYEDNPSILIELKNIDFLRHALKCEDCGAFKNDFGTTSTQWHIEWNNKKYRLNLSRLGKKYDATLIQWSVGYYFTGTKLKFIISTETVASLEDELAYSESIENFEHCAFLRDRIKEIKEG